MFQLSICWILFIVHLSRGSRWPRKKFVLPQPQNGCPSKFKAASFSLKKNLTNGSKTIDGRTDLKTSSLTYHVCAKNNEKGTGNFSQGKYCVYKFLDLTSLTCPFGMKNGSIQWNYNSEKFDPSISPVAGIYIKTTTLHYCCKVDGDKTKAIQLPTETPFFLFAYNSTLCQTVKWMEAWVEFLQYRKQDFVKEKFTSGAHPFLSPSYRLHYCFYKGCRQFIKERQSGVIQTGNETFKSQTRYCSWKITSQTNSIISIKFTDFKFIGQPSLNFVSVYDGEDSHGRLLGTFSARKSPLNHQINISSSTTLFILLRCFRKNNETECRFKAKYLICSECTSAAPTSVSYGSTKTPLSKSSQKTVNPKDHSTTMKLLSNISDSNYDARVQDNNTVIYAPLGTILALFCFIAVITFVIYKKKRKRRSVSNSFRGTRDGNQDENADIIMDPLLLDNNDSLEEISFVINSNSVLRLSSQDTESGSALGNQNESAHTRTYLPLTQSACGDELYRTSSF